MIANENIVLSTIENKLNEQRFSDLKAEVAKFCEKIENRKLREIFCKTFFNTIHSTVLYKDDSVFVITGDIPAMWLRDSSVQVMQCLFFADKCESVRVLIKDVLKKQFELILIDPYANAFNCEANANGHITDVDRQHPHVWERKFELDSLCYPLFLLIKYFRMTGDITVFNDTFLNAFDTIIKTFRTEQNHAENSEYYHFNKMDSDKFVGRGTPVSNGGLVWSGYRPSDDKCAYGYYLPGNMFIVSVLTGLEPIFGDVLGDKARAEVCRSLAAQIQSELEKLAVVTAENGKRIYALETDGLGNYNLMDDANIPNLLSVPYYEYPYIDKEVYANTRDFVLSERNPYYYEGKALKGIGSPHTPENYIWPLSVIIRALTSTDHVEINECVDMLVNSTGGTGYMHESVHKDDEYRFTRPWFAWANSLFAYLVLEKKDFIGGIDVR